MKQIIQSYSSGEIWLAETPPPVCKDNGVLVQTASSLVSAGTEKLVMELAKKSLLGKAKARPDLVKKVLAKIKTEGAIQTIKTTIAMLNSPIPLGYSAAGVVVEAGRNVLDLKPGDRVACAGADYATHADYNYVPKNLCVKIPGRVSFEDACFAAVGAIAMQGVRQADVRIGERVVVIGLGLLGLLTVQILKAGGCSVLGMDIDKDKCDMAKKLGADEAVSTDLIRASDNFTQGYGADSVIITAATKSNQPVENAAAISRLKGRIVVVGMVGMDIPREPFYKKELDLRLSMSYGPGRYDVSYEQDCRDYPFGYVRWTEQRNMQSFLTLVADDKVTPSKLITHRFPIDKALEAYDLLERGRGGEKQENYIGIVITYPPIDSSAIPSKTVKLREVNPNARNNTGVGFIGAGNFARSVLVPALKKIDNVQLLGLCTATGISGTETGKKHGFAYATTDYRQILADERIDAVFVATHHNSHAHFACEALASGKNVFVEKPLCLSPEDFGKFQDALETAVAKDYNPVLMVGFNRRFSRHAKVLKNVFASRTTPLIINYRISAGSIPKDTWIQRTEIGGGRIIGEVCHFVDFCGFLIGSSPVRVFADCIASDNTSVTPEDSVVITISYSDGSIATIQYLAVGSSILAKERAEIHADGITAVLDNFTKTEFFGAKCKSVKGKQDKGFDIELNEFFKVIRHGGQWPIPLENLIQTTKVTFAIVESLRLGQPVSLLG